MSYIQEEKVIRKAIMEHYHEGHAKHDFRYYEGILHDEWKLFYLDDNGKMQVIDKETYMSWYKPEDFDENIHWETDFFYVDIILIFEHELR